MVTGPFFAPPETYLFIDGGYLRKVADELMQAVFGIPADIDLAAVRRNLSPHPRRVFYYDCLNDVHKDGESDSDFDLRVQKQQAAFDAIQSLDGFHVRLGSVSGKNRKIRQKKVDVLLAVDTLDHAFRKNMQQVFLIAGDLDFVPLVDSLIRLGTYVRIIYQPRSAARGLYSAADLASPLTFNEVYFWTTEEFRKQHPIPTCATGPGMPTPGPPLKTGTAANRTVQLYQRGAMFGFYCPRWDHHPLLVESPDLKLLEKYLKMEYASIEWK